MEKSPVLTVQFEDIIGRHITWFTILITITCAAYFTFLIRDFIMYLHLIGNDRVGQ